jgi:hypothetical protein
LGSRVRAHGAATVAEIWQFEISNPQNAAPAAYDCFSCSRNCVGVSLVIFLKSFEKKNWS